MLIRQLLQGPFNKYSYFHGAEYRFTVITYLKNVFVMRMILLLCFYSLNLLFICRLGSFSLRCSLTNTDVLTSVATEEVFEDSTSLDSNCSIPVVHLKTDTLDAEGINLLAGGTYVDTILTALPVRILANISLFLNIYSVLRIMSPCIAWFLVFFNSWSSCRSYPRRNRTQLLQLLLIQLHSMVSNLLHIKTDKFTRK